jgi:uncharacterized hydrophobic protein (TIGR00271 family)
VTLTQDRDRGPEPGRAATTEADQPFRRRRAWWQRHLEPEDRRRVMADLAVTRVDHWAWRFVTMLTLSVVVAVMGLALDSAAVVIGAMLLAPLMQPVLATGASLSMALFTKSMVSLAKVAAASLWCIGIAYLLAWILPDEGLTNEVLARTQPDIKDLVVALAAGAAGAYATVRADVSASLPGVAVAVALVPPVASVGITLRAGEEHLAQGALLLYLTNLAAIVFASIVVFVVTGFVPPRRLSSNLLRLTLAGVAAVAVVIVVAVPLYQASIESIDRNTEQRTAEEIVDRWLGDQAGSMERTVEIRRPTGQIVVEVRGFDQPPDQANLLIEMGDAFPDYDVVVPFIQTQRATTTTQPPPEPTEQLLAEIRVQVIEWLDESGVDYQLDDIRLDGSLVRIDAAGTGDAPAIAGLVPRLAAIDETLSPGLSWVRLETFTETTLPSPLELTREELRAAVAVWAEAEGVELRGFDYDGERAEIDVTGPVAPDIVRLEVALRDLAGNGTLPVDVYFTERYLVTTTTPPEPSPLIG